MGTTGVLHGSLEDRSPRWDVQLLGGLILLANLPLLVGLPDQGWVLLPDRVGQGEWWRLLLHPFVHVSAYHLLLDGVAFALLYDGLRGPTVGGRLATLAGCWFGGTVLPLLLAPQVSEIGLCGLSGIDHGLMAVSALEGLESRDAGERRLGALFLATVLGKSILELATGRAFFSFLHFGLLGVPVVACHLGGVLGGTAAHFWLRPGSPARGRSPGVRSVHSLYGR